MSRRPGRIASSYVPRSRAGPHSLTHSLNTQVQRENSRFRTLMAAQLNAAGEEHGPARAQSRFAADEEAHRVDEHGDEVPLRGEEESPRGERAVS